MTSTSEETLREKFKVLGSKQAGRSKMVFAPDWIVRAAQVEKTGNSWTEEHTEVKVNNVPWDANVIISHFFVNARRKKQRKRA